jgi:hypothetical protein
MIPHKSIIIKRPDGEYYILISKLAMIKADYHMDEHFGIDNWSFKNLNEEYLWNYHNYISDVINDPNISVDWLINKISWNYISDDCKKLNDIQNNNYVWNNKDTFYIKNIQIGDTIKKEIQKTKEQTNWEEIEYRMESGIDYCMREYSDWEEINDKEFHNLRNKYIKISDQLEKYIDNKMKQFKEVKNEKKI